MKKASLISLQCVMCSYKVGDWIHDKLTVATDEAYRDPTNLQSKLQKHQAFEAELSSNKDRVDTVCKVLHCAHARMPNNTRAWFI